MKENLSSVYLATGGTFNFIGTTTATNNYYALEIEGNAHSTASSEYHPLTPPFRNMEVNWRVHSPTPAH